MRLFSTRNVATRMILALHPSTSPSEFFSQPNRRPGSCELIHCASVLSYTFLRLGLQDYLLQPDLLDPVDLHAAKPSGLNARVTNLGNGQRRRTRLGVYLHWVLPPLYRQALGSSGAASGNDTNVKQQVPHILILSRESTSLAVRAAADQSRLGFPRGARRPLHSPVPGRTPQRRISAQYQTAGS